MGTYEVKIIVAAHKAYRMPEDAMYLPLHVGAEGKKDADGNPLNLGYAKDNTGENISGLNASFCELTGLYWAWKNLHADYIGLTHYRRHFSMKRRAGFDNILTYAELEPYLGKVRVFTPNKRRYYIETLYSHYAHTHYAVHLDETKKIIAERWPEYRDSYEKVLHHRYGYMFNMAIMQQDMLNDYCTWLFDILFELQRRIDMPQLSAFQGRFYGRVSEIIFNVWLDHKLASGELRRDEVMEIPVFPTEKINWKKKAIAFLKAKFIGKKYEGSF